MNNNKTYWDKKIIEWEDSIRTGGNICFVERLASHFRRPLKFRTEICIEMLKPIVKDKKVLELGCGSGFFAFELYDRCKPMHITGMDISVNAIGRAQKIARDKKLTDKFGFTEGDITSISLPESDVTIGLGFLDYLTSAEIKTVFDNIRSNYFLFTFTERRFSLLRYIHILYLWSQKCPRHFYYTKNEMANCIDNKYGKVRFFNDRRLSFGCMVHNLPIP